MSQLAFQCPHCAEPFQVAIVQQGQAVVCPHCGQAVAVPPRPGANVSPPTSTHQQRLADRDPPPFRRAEASGKDRASGESPISVQAEPKRIVHHAGQAYEVHSLTPEERAAFRRRVNLVVFGITALALALAVVGLLLWSEP
jgi:hypothetical protein